MKSARNIIAERIISGELNFSLFNIDEETLNREFVYFLVKKHKVLPLKNLVHFINQNEQKELKQAVEKLLEEKQLLLNNNQELILNGEHNVQSV